MAHGVPGGTSSPIGWWAPSFGDPQVENVLVTSDHTVKLIDFGFENDFQKTQNLLFSQRKTNVNPEIRIAVDSACFWSSRLGGPQKK